MKHISLYNFDLFKTTYKKIIYLWLVNCMQPNKNLNLGFGISESYLLKSRGIEVNLLSFSPLFSLINPAKYDK